MSITINTNNNKLHYNTTITGGNRGKEYMEIKFTISILRNTKPNSNKVINAYKNIYVESKLSELPESVQSLQEGVLDINNRLRRLEAKLRKV